MFKQGILIFTILIGMFLLYGCNSTSDYLEGEKIDFSIDTSKSKIEYIVVGMLISSRMDLIQNQDEIDEMVFLLNNIEVVKQDEDIFDDVKARYTFGYTLEIGIAFSYNEETTYMVYMIHEDGSVMIRDVDQNLYMSDKNAVDYKALTRGFR